MDILGWHGRRRRPARARVGQGGAQHQRPDPGPGPRDTFAQIVAEELGISPDDIQVRHGDTDRTPFGLAPTAAAPPRSPAPRRRRRPQVRDKAVDRGRNARDLARGPGLGEGPLVRQGRSREGRDDRGDRREGIRCRPAPRGCRGGLDGQSVYDPPNLTYPCGAYICVVDIDPETAEVKVRRFIAVDDCGVRINPMVVDGQIMGGLAEGVGLR